MKIGILGGGQLSRMLALSGIPLGIEFDFYFPNKMQALNPLGKAHVAEYDDWESLQYFCDQVDVITYENENIKLETLDFLAKSKNIYPDKNVLRVSQDRLLEKALFGELEIPTNRYMAVNSLDELFVAIQTLGYPLMLKKCREGYDGKGQAKINNPSDLSKISVAQCTNAIAEEFVRFDREISLIAARNKREEVVFYDICENVHRDGILFKTVNRFHDSAFAAARNYVEKVLKALDYVGVLTIEFFQVGEQLIANEMAPRVHNSGHWTLDACVTSQFENHVRAILNLPLGDSTSLSQACMYNLLSKMPDITTLLACKGSRLYDYKKTPEKGRKLGHISLLNDDPNRLNELEEIITG